MFAHPATQENIEKLRSFGNHIIEPAEGELASHLIGKGRMEEPDIIVQRLEDFFATQTDLQKKKILITAGPTYEKIDPVRFIGNYSSGKMGFALAEACAHRGAEVILIAGPVSLETKHPRINRINVESAEEMYQAATTRFPESNAAILCAAVADYRPDTVSEDKIKRENKEEMTLHLVANKDIAASLGVAKRSNQILIGFALETSHELTHAADKLRRKNFDFIVLNSLREPGAGFQVDTNKIVILDAKGDTTSYPLKSKQEVALDIVNKLVTLLP
jgi:phosphopantothenoylcysteine decarboxylase/phosphopantothenate--cysteine ligase